MWKVITCAEFSFTLDIYKQNLIEKTKNKWQNNALYIFITLVPEIKKKSLKNIKHTYHIKLT